MVNKEDVVSLQGITFFLGGVLCKYVIRCTNNIHFCLWHRIIQHSQQ